MASSRPGHLRTSAAGVPHRAEVVPHDGDESGPSCYTRGPVRCPFCKDPAAGSKVIDSRESGGGYVIRRRRECLACERRYTTYERMEESPLKVVKQDGRREPFERAKIVASLEGCCQKRPVSEEQI